jgi:tRNA1(Val) A37 N6-methylase TrmN6
MEREEILKKFGKENYQVNDNTYIMGIHHLLGEHIAQRFKGYDKVLEACTGAGFMLINLIKNAKNVFTVEINPEHLEQAKNNLRIAGLDSNIRFILGDVMSEKILNKISKIDAAFLDPDWSPVGKNKLDHTTKLSDMQPSAEDLFNRITKKTQNIALRLPRELDLNELKKLPPHELEKIYLNDDFKFYCAYFGRLKNNTDNTEFRAFTS